jgi:hypothetical protein
MIRFIAILLIVLPVVCYADIPPSIDFYTDATIVDGNVFSVVRTFDNAKVEMSGGIINELWLYEASTFNSYNGSIENYITLNDSSVLNLRGLNQPWGNNILCAWGNSSINIYGKGFEYYDPYHLRGYWANGNPFDFSIRTDYTRGRISLFVIPEPCSFILICLGILGLSKKNR